ncbi:hypothetical protein CDD80_7600 [Ophiocordyceps camponoti-rufipedis]|uniref:F5/8 type C domain-containing protein n=1 Tax=Ophiocordyceps camponoti-rufipedis TaxID=2004952 RepID=A0A2C5YIM7_9HYPO|nr:hypothetical protein CDD80_7600 [Ophiocordyceps camponoti-rufipedis]
MALTLAIQALLLLLLSPTAITASPANNGLSPTAITPLLPNTTTHSLAPTLLKRSPVDEDRPRGPDPPPTSTSRLPAATPDWDAYEGDGYFRSGFSNRRGGSRLRPEFEEDDRFYSRNGVVYIQGRNRSTLRRIIAFVQNCITDGPLQCVIQGRQRQIPHDQPSTSRQSNNNPIPFHLDRNRSPVLYFIDSPDPMVVLQSGPSPSRQLPHPQPTGYSPEGEPLFEWWYTMPVRPNQMGWNGVPNDLTRPFQLIPKTAGCYSPLNGAIGSESRICPEEGPKPEAEGEIPLVFGLPGAPGSSWYFSPLPPRSALPPGLSGPTRLVPADTEDDRRAMGSINFDAVTALDRALAQSVGDTVVWALLDALFSFIRPYSRGQDCLDLSNGRYIATYLPHLVQVIMELIRQRRNMNPDPNQPGPHQKRSMTVTAESHKLCAISRGPKPAEEAPEPGLSISCAPAGPMDNTPSLRLGNWTRAEICQVFSKATEIPEMEPTINIQCGVSRDTAAVQPAKPSEVYLCKENGFSEPCTNVAAPLSKCVDVTGQLSGAVTSLRPSVAAGTCAFYTERGCRGGRFEARYPGIDLYLRDDVEYRSVFNDKVASFQCNGTVKPTATSLEPKKTSGNQHWVWSSQMLEQQCTHFDRLWVQVRIGDPGSYDQLKLEFVGSEGKQHFIAESPDKGFRMWQDVDLNGVFKTDVISINRIRRVRLVAVPTNSFSGGRPWKLDGIRFRARCAKSGYMVEHTKLLSINKRVEISNSYGGDLWLDSEYTGWEGFVNPEDWMGTPPCSHFRTLNVVLQIANRHWAGTSNDIYVHVGRKRFLLAHSPEVAEAFPITIDLRQAFGAKSVPFANLTRISLSSQGGHDEAFPKKIRIDALCDSEEQMLLRIERWIQRWIPDGGRWGFGVEPSSWSRII